MKFNLKKVATVIGTTLMLGATVGMAAAASFTPSSFSSDGIALVVGQNAANSDLKAAMDLTANLAPSTSTSTTTSSTVEGGDSFKIEKTSTKFHLGDYIGNITSSNIDEDDMPTLLADGKYLDDDNDEFDYKQKIVLNNDTIQLKMFSDNDYAKDTPTLGFRLTNEEFILNYTLDFTDKPYFNDMETTDIPIMGKQYYVLDVTSDNTTLTLLDSAENVILTEGETTTVTVNGKSYEIAISYITSSTVKLSVNGEVTNSLSATQTYKLSDGAYVGIKEVLARDVAGVLGQVEFGIGSGKLKIENGAKVEMNDEDIKNVYGYVVNSSNQLDDIVLKWTANDETFITAGTEGLLMPGFEAVKFKFAGINFPTEETFAVQAGGNDYVELSDFPLKGGALDIAILGKASGDTNYTFIGSDTDELLVTSAGSTLTFDGSSDSNDEYFIVSWSDTDTAESYLVRATGFNDPSSGDDTVDIEYNDGSGWVRKYDNAEQGDEINFGNADLTLTTVTSNVGSESVVFTAGSNVEFDVLYSKEGLKVQLPWYNTTALVSASNYTTAMGACAQTFVGTGAYAFNMTYNATSQGGLKVQTCYPYSSYQLLFYEEDKDDDKAEGAAFNITIGNNGASNYYSSVTAVNNATSGREKSATDIYESWMYGALATKFVEDDSGDQDMVTITYHGSEVTADAYLLAPSATVTPSSSGSTTTTGVMTVWDNQVASVSNKNLIVIGGSCVNSVAAELLGVSAGASGCQGIFEEKTGIKAGEALVKSFARSGKTALLVAGYNAADTEKAVAYVSNNAIDTTVDAALKVTSATAATAIVN